MNDDDFKKLVSNQLDFINGQLAGITDRLDAMFGRLEEQDTAVDILTRQVDRLAVLAMAGEEAMTSLAALGRRANRLENTDGKKA